jgi:hypothetical protein
MPHRILYFTVLQLVVYSLGLVPMFVVYQNTNHTQGGGSRTAALPTQVERALGLPTTPSVR